MIKREMYMKRIRPFIGTELIKVMTGIRRCGKSVMLELIKEELVESGISSAQFISINFENLNFSHLQTAKSLHDEITKRAAEINGKVYLFFDEIQEVKDWRSVSIPSVYPLTATSISPVQTQNFCPVSFPPISADALWSSLFTHSPSRNFWNCTVPSHRMSRSRNAFRSIYYPAVCRTLPTSATRMLLPSSTFMTCSTLSSSRTL